MPVCLLAVALIRESGLVVLAAVRTAGYVAALAALVLLELVSLELAAVRTARSAVRQLASNDANCLFLITMPSSLHKPACQQAGLRQG